MAPYLHPNVTMVLPRFAGAIVGAETLVASFEEFCTAARVLEYEETDEHIHVIDNVAVVNYQFNMLYERSSYRARSIGRDIWIFRRANERWQAVWRTMVDLKEVRESR
jgi:hypothetical protein